MRALTQIARSIFPGPDPLLEIKYFFHAREPDEDDDDDD